MNISSETVAVVVGLFTVLSGIFGAYRVVITMREQIKTLFRQVEAIKAEKDEDIKSLNERLKTLENAIQEGNKTIVATINDLHIKLLEKIAESKSA
jgi:predicted PurR-regulated permease PerM